MKSTIIVCDSCGQQIGENEGAKLRVNYADARHLSKQADLCNDCAEQMPGEKGKRRDRRPYKDQPQQTAAAV